MSADVGANKVNQEEGMKMHRRDALWLASALVLPLVLIFGAGAASAQEIEGDLDLEDIDPATVLDHVTHPPLAGGGDALWQGGSLEFPGEQANDQIYRSVAAELSASRPECDSGTAQVTVSVQVENEGPNPGAGYSGALRLFEPGDPVEWEDNVIGQHSVTVSAPVGLVETLTVSVAVPAEGLAAGDVFAHLALETFHGAGPKTWTADELSATYAFDTTGCAPGIAIEKTGDGPDPIQVGDTIEYSFLITNTGDLTLTGITVIDPLPGMSSIDCPDDSLAPGAEMTCTSTYTVTQEDADTGFVENTAMVSGSPPDGPPVTAEDGAVVPPSQKPGISIEKSASGPDPLEVGATVDYSFLVTNTGNVTLSDITVTDPLDGLSPIDCPDDTLAPGAEMTCTATYTVTQEDVDAGAIENTGSVTATPPGDLPPPTDEDTTTFPPDQNPGISMEKSGSGPDPLTVGATIDYTFLVTNTGNVTLTNVTVTDPLPGLSPISCPDTTLAPGAEMTCSATYTVTQADVEDGVVQNTATVTGTPPAGLPPPTDTDTTTFPPDQNTGIAIEKSGSGPDPLTVGATIEYTFVVTNTGDVTLSNITITDPLDGLSPISCPATTLAPGAEMTCTATYTVTQSDVDAGIVQNTATVTGQTPGGGPPATGTDTTQFPPVPPVPAVPPLAFVLLLALLATGTLWTLRRACA